MRSITIYLLSLLLLAASVTGFIAGGRQVSSKWGINTQESCITSAPIRVLMSESDTTNIIAADVPSLFAEEESTQSRKVERERHTIFVGNLPFETSSQDIKELFEQYGKVDLVAIPKNKLTDQARGFAFVDMSSREELDAAVAAVDGSLMGSRELRAMRSIPQEEREKTEKKPARNASPQRNNRPDDSTKKIYVGNIPFDTTSEALMEVFSQFGSIRDVFVPSNAQTGAGRGFAFVTMENEGDIDKTIEETNGLEFQGRTLVVNKPLPPGEKAPGRKGGRTKLYIGNLSFYTVAETLREIFEEFGTVLDCYLPEDPSTGGTRGFGFITMVREDAMTAVSELDGCEVDGRVIRVNEAKPKGRESDE